MQLSPTTPIELTTDSYMKAETAPARRGVVHIPQFSTYRLATTIIEFYSSFRKCLPISDAAPLYRGEVGVMFNLNDVGPTQPRRSSRPVISDADAYIRHKSHCRLTLALITVPYLRPCPTYRREAAVNLMHAIMSNALPLLTNMVFTSGWL